MDILSSLINNHVYMTEKIMEDKISFKDAITYSFNAGHSSGINNDVEENFYKKENFNTYQKAKWEITNVLDKYEDKLSLEDLDDLANFMIDYKLDAIKESMKEEYELQESKEMIGEPVT